MSGKPRNNAQNKLHLPEVTLCTVDCLHPQLALRALELSAGQCRFASIKFFTDQPVETPFEVTLIDPIRSKADYSDFILRELCRHIETPYALIVQWDGYVLDASRWRPEFLQFDYIGAKWTVYADRRVGNGGFSLRSHRLLHATRQMPAVSGANEDLLICREWASTLERGWGISFAPVEVADRFAHEHSLPDAPTFGFHGLSNMWRYVSDHEMIAIARALDPRTTFETDYAGCMIAYLLQRRFQPFTAFYRRWRQTMSPGEILKLLHEFRVVQQFADDCVRIGETLMEER